MSGKTNNWTNNQATDPAEQFNLARCYYYGDGGVPQDYQQAVYWYRKAAEQGDTAAQCNLGRCYYYGDGVPQDYQQAVYWLRKAAAQGHCEAQYNLGVCYEDGDGVAQDYQQAVYWYRKAAAQGDTDAKRKLRTWKAHIGSHMGGLENMRNINWKLVSIGAGIGGVVSAFVWSNYVIAIICLILLFISAHMQDEADIADDEVFIRKYYNIHGDTLLKSEELLTKLAREIELSTGRREALFVLRARVERFIYDVQRGKKKK